MAYHNKQLLTDAYGKIIPQYYDQLNDTYKPLTDPTKGAVITDLNTGSVTVTTTQVELTSGLSGRTQLIIYPPSTGTIYWGKTGVTSSSGAPLSAGSDPVEFTFADSTLKIFGVSDGTDRQIRVVECK